MSGVVKSRSIAYSADTAGRAGRIACQVVRSDSADGGRISYAIAIRNDTGSDAQASAFVPDALDLRHRTIVQSIIGAHSQFSTAVELDVERFGEIPELHVQLAGEDIAFALIVPNAYAAVGAEAPAPRLALATPTNAVRPTLPAAPPEPRKTVLLRAVPRVTSRGDYGSMPRPTPADRRLADSVAVVGGAQKSPAALPMVAIFLVILIAVAIAVFRPQIRELTVPVQASAQTPIVVAYRATGLGSVSYQVVGPAGDRFADGPLAGGAGTFALTFPKDRVDRAYLVRVSIGNTFSSAVAEDYVKVPGTPIPVAAAPRRAPRPIEPPEIRSLALDRAALNGGDTLNVYYNVAAANGSVALLDAGSQIAYGTSALSSSGHTAFVVPLVQSERFLTVVLTVHRGNATADSRVAVTVQPQNSPAPQADTGDSGAQIPGSVAVAVPVIDAPSNVRSAQPIRLDIHDAVAGLVLVLSDNNGAELARREISVDSARTTATFTAPAVRVRTSVRVQASYPQGAGSETIVKTIDITPR